VRVLVVTWAPGGNLPPLVAASSVLARRGHEVQFLASAETSELPEQSGFPVTRYRRSPNPETKVVFESQADVVMALMAGTELALDARDVLVDLRPDLAIVDCMLPAAIAAARATGTPTASLVHFLYGLARSQMLRAGGGWTTDLHSLGRTHRTLELAPARDGLAAWEAPEMLLVTAPRWLDIDADTPSHVVYAGPLDVKAGHDAAGSAGRARPAVLLTFSTTVMDGQAALIDRVCQAIAPLDLDATLTLGPAVDRDVVHLHNVEAVGFADHDLLMPGCAVVVNHGGLGTVLRALAHGVPQLLLPLGRDQAFNASRVEALHAGIQLPIQASPKQIQTALQTLIATPRFRAAAADLAMRMATADADRTAAEALERIGRGA
jgi:UDP:flavonoid glycosyltransferase YjiC (YdhE family)